MIKMMTKEIIKFYEERYNDCMDNWTLIDVKRKKIKGLSCVLKTFHTTRTHEITTFLFVNGVIIGYIPNFIEYINIFGEDL